MKILTKTLGAGAIALLAIVAVLVVYLGGTVVGAMIPRYERISIEDTHDDASQTIYLISGLLHADIALPATEKIRRRYFWLSDYGFPLDHPNLAFIAIGWGSKAFYTTAGTYADIKASAVFTAVTGDEAVMRFTPLGPIERGEGITPLELSSARLEALMAAIDSSLRAGVDGKLFHLAAASIGPGDAFFKARGDFNIFYPCNQWVGRVLNEAGVRTGIWTPTTWSLVSSIGRWN